jgi:uncharacterized DUF497 family protein
MYEWDEAKRAENLKKHRIDFAIVERFDWEHSITDEDRTERYYEPRFISIGPIGRQIYVLVWSDRPGDIVRVISLRKATKQERKRHEEEH